MEVKLPTLLGNYDRHGHREISPPIFFSFFWLILSTLIGHVLIWIQFSLEALPLKHTICGFSFNLYICMCQPSLINMNPFWMLCKGARNLLSDDIRRIRFPTCCQLQPILRPHPRPLHRPHQLPSCHLCSNPSLYQLALAGWIGYWHRWRQILEQRRCNWCGCLTYSKNNKLPAYFERNGEK